MSLQVQRGLALIGFGLLLGFVGLVWLANLFGVADEHAKFISENRVNRWLAGEQRSPAEVRNSDRFRAGIALGRMFFGGGLMLFGLVFVIGGIRYLVAPPIG